MQLRRCWKLPASVLIVVLTGFTPLQAAPHASPTTTPVTASAATNEPAELSVAVMVPEPASLLLLLGGLFAFAYARSRGDERRAQHDASNARPTPASPANKR